MKQLTFAFPFFILMLMGSGCDALKEQSGKRMPKLRVSENKHYFVDEDGKPFFWLGDTGWLLFKKLNRSEAEQYLEHRRQHGFNVVQAMVLHDLNDDANVYGHHALINNDIGQPLVTADTAFADTAAYDYWDHVDYILSLAQAKGIYMALVPIWGSNVKNGKISPEQMANYGQWLAQRYADRPNVIWLNGGDIRGDKARAAWDSLGCALDRSAPEQLITFHPRGRTQSSWWFHARPWLDFNMIQSGHRRYDQDDTQLAYGEDNWRYIETDFMLHPAKPTIDGEPSYEGIPQGLHDTLQPLWNDADARRYAYWAVFAGALGHTYGHNAVMQFFSQGQDAAYGNKATWTDALNAPGAVQMQHLKSLMLSRPYLERRPDQSILLNNTGTGHNYLLATRGERYAFVYSCTGKKINVDLGKLLGKVIKASWFNPRNGTAQEIGDFAGAAIASFDPPGEPAQGNDWVLVLDVKE